MTNEISRKTVGMILEAVAIPIMIVNIMLLRMPNTDLGTSTVLLVVSNIMLFTGIILHHFPQDKNKGEEK